MGSREKGLSNLSEESLLAGHSRQSGHLSAVTCQLPRAVLAHCSTAHSPATNSSSIPWIWEWLQKKEKLLIYSHVGALTYKPKGLICHADWRTEKASLEKVEGLCRHESEEGVEKGRYTSLPESHGSHVSVQPF